jgi:hypothetical protein
MCRFAALALTTLLANSAWAQQAAPPAADTTAPSAKVVAMEEPLPGDHWTYEERDEITGSVNLVFTAVITEVTPTEISVRTTKAGGSGGGLVVYDRSWSLISSGEWRYAPNDGNGVRLPLAVGDTQAIQSNQVNTQKGFSYKRSGTSKVLDQETLTTKAGTFETFKIETTVSIRNVNDPTGKNELTIETWYAPAIDHWVKRTSISRTDHHLRSQTTSELIDYGRKQ